MLGNHKLVLDTHCEIYEYFKHDADRIFWSFRQHIDQGKMLKDAVYVFGRQQFQESAQVIRYFIENQGLKVVFSNPHEGSDTMRGHCLKYGIFDLVSNKKILMVGGGDMEPHYALLQFESFLPKILDYKENLEAMTRINEIFDHQQKPYKFLFLNGRWRPHRDHLLKYFKHTGLLDQALWSNLDHRDSVMAVKHLPAKYEISRYRDRLGQPAKLDSDMAAKHHLFNKEWGEVYITPGAYIDSYFSLVTETVFEYPYSFRTEKIWKPIAMGHPWIAVANRGYYRDMRALGFKTFDNLINESFDLIENGQDRLKRIINVIEDLCKQDLDSFQQACVDICKYNQQHLVELAPRIRQEFPLRFTEFIKTNFNE